MTRLCSHFLTSFTPEKRRLPSLLNHINRDLCSKSSKTRPMNYKLLDANNTFLCPPKLPSARFHRVVTDILFPGSSMLTRSKGTQEPVSKQHSFISAGFHPHSFDTLSLLQLLKGFPYTSTNRIVQSAALLALKTCSKSELF